MFKQSRTSPTAWPLKTIISPCMKRNWWLGHTLRRPPGDIAKAALEWNPQGTRSHGRSRTTWRRTILEEIRHQGKTWNEVKVLASNRVSWRNFVRALCFLEEWRETISIYIWNVTKYQSMLCNILDERRLLCIQFTSSCPISLRSISLLPSKLYVSLPSCFCSSALPANTQHALYSLPYLPSTKWFSEHNNIWKAVLILKTIIHP